MEKLKNILNRYNEAYMNIKQEAENLKDVVGSFDHWQYQLRPALIIKLGISQTEYKIKPRSLRGTH